jgi:hypothetical protein
MARTLLVQAGVETPPYSLGGLGGRGRLTMQALARAVQRLYLSRDSRVRITSHRDPSGAATFASRSLRSLACGPDLHIELHGYDSVAGECEILVNALETAGYRARHVETNRPVTARSVHEAIPGHVDAQS